MEKYNYMDAMIEDIRDYINENIDAEAVEDMDELEEQLRDELQTEDHITGAGSGTYAGSRKLSREYVTTAGMDLLNEAFEEGYIDADTVCSWFLHDDWESMDVTIRCYLLPRAISEALVGFTVDIPF